MTSIRQDSLCVYRRVDIFLCELEMFRYQVLWKKNGCSI